MKEVTINAQSRDSVGKGPARRARSAGLIPGVLYGPEIKPRPLSVDERVLRAAVRQADGTSSIFDLDVDGNSTKVVIRELQRDPVTSKVAHIDFHAISMTKPIHISIPIRFSGTPIGVKTDGGIMQVTMRELAISCLPANIPEHFEVDVSELSIGDSIHVRDLSIPDTNILAEPQRTIVVISAPTVVKAADTEAEEGEAVEGEEPAVEGEEPASEEAAPEAEKKKE